MSVRKSKKVSKMHLNELKVRIAKARTNGDTNSEYVRQLIEALAQRRAVA